MPQPEQGRRPLDDYLEVQVSADRELNRVLELAARQASRRIRTLRLGDSFSAAVRAAQLDQVLAQIVRAQRDTWVSGVGPIILRSYPKAAAAAAKSFELIEQVLEAVLGNDAARLIGSFKQTAKAGLELDRVRRARALSPRVYRNAALASGEIECQIRAGIIQGLSARELAGNVSRFISPNTPGGVAYAAKRLARTELNNAFHESQKIQGEAPWVKGMKWNLSNSHPKAVPDRCDLLATQNIHGLGRGMYPAGDLPDKPHPQCLCFTTYSVISETDMLDLLPSLLDAGFGGEQIA